MTILSGIMFFIYVMLPIFFLMKIWRNYSPNLLKWLISTSASAGYVVCLFVIGGWPMQITGYYMRYILLITLIFSIIKSYLNQKRRFFKAPRRYLITVICSGVIGLLPIIIIVMIFCSSFRIPKAINIDFPLKNGEYYIVQGGNSIFTNHHQGIDAQKYAIDIIKLNRFGLRSKVLNALVSEDYNIYQDMIYSPCNGRIIELVDEYPDLEPHTMDPDHPAGNYLAIEMESQQLTVLLAHIQKGSFLVKKGELVTQGQALSRVGNSGNTSEPHLHIHIIKTGGDLLYGGEGVPMKFNNRFLVRNDRVSSILGGQKRK